MRPEESIHQSKAARWAEIMNEPSPSGPVRLLLSLLAPAEWAFGGIVAIRNGLYSSGAVSIRRLPCRVVSIGNLAAGGTGKTPTVLDAMVRLTASGRRVGVLSRGYGGTHSRSVAVLGPGDLADPESVGDEPAMIRRRFPDVPIGIGQSRYQTGVALLSAYPVDVLILDDGFQRRSLHRDVDVVLLDSIRPFGNGYLLPRGILREPVSSLVRATAVVETRVREEGGATMVSDASLSGRARFRWRARATDLWDVASGESIGLDAVKGKRVILMSGIGSPGSFRRTAREAGAVIAGEVIYRDHHRYNPLDLGDVAEQARAVGAEAILTTEKDGVKCGKGRPGGFPLWALAMALDWLGGEEAWRDLLLGRGGAS